MSDLGASFSWSLKGLYMVCTGIAFWRSCVISVRLSVGMEQVGSHWTDFYEIRLFFENLLRIISLNSS
jgi:hypothetical protein